MTPADNLTVADTLDRAADYIEEHGWTRKGFCRDGRVCLLGAVSAVVTGDPEDWANPRVEEFRWAIDQITWERFNHCAVYWNDRQRSRRPVLRLLRDTARDLREKGS